MASPAESSGAEHEASVGTVKGLGRSCSLVKGLPDEMGQRFAVSPIMRNSSGVVCLASRSLAKDCVKLGLPGAFMLVAYGVIVRAKCVRDLAATEPAGLNPLPRALGSAGDEVRAAGKVIS